MNLQDILNQQDIWRVSRAYQSAKVAEVEQQITRIFLVLVRHLRGHLKMLLEPVNQ